ncbi:MAG: hypothetical protein IJW21_06780, partial [Clostridia bacterium]|nr:hypothetical protein [Clostridia bacterium]
MPRRGENIFKRTDGRWEARYIHHYENGKAKYRYLYAHTYIEVKAKRQAEMQCTEKFTSARPKDCTTLEILAGAFLANIKISVKESTYTRYHRILHKYILPDIGNLHVSKIDTYTLNKLAERLLLRGGKGGKPLSPKTVSDIMSLMKSVFRFGRENGFPNTAFSGVRLPQKAHAEAEILTAESRKKLEAA